jgi:hypothetical protein
VSKVNENDISGFLVRQICLSEETIVECDGSAIVNKSDALQTCDLSSIKNALSLYIAKVRGNRDDNVICGDA